MVGLLPAEALFERVRLASKRSTSELHFVRPDIRNRYVHLSTHFLAWLKINLKINFCLQRLHDKGNLTRSAWSNEWMPSYFTCPLSISITSIFYFAAAYWLVLQHRFFTARSNLGSFMNTSMYGATSYIIFYIQSKNSRFFWFLKRKYNEESLGNLFANAYFGNSVVAILSGVLAQLVANQFGYVYVDVRWL